MHFLSSLLALVLSVYGGSSVGASISESMYNTSLAPYHVAQEAPPGGFGGGFSPPPGGGDFGGGGNFGGGGMMGGQPSGGFEGGGSFGGGQPMGGGQQQFNNNFGKPGEFGDGQGFGGQQGGMMGGPMMGPRKPGEFDGQQGQFGQGQFGGDKFGGMGGMNGRQGKFGQGQQFGGGENGQKGFGMMGGQQGKQFGQGQQFGEEQGFSNEGEDSKRDAENEKRQAEQDKRCVQDVQRGLKDFEKFAIKDIERRINQAKRKKVTIPASMTEALEKMKALLTEVKGATACDDAQEAMQELFTVQQDNQEEFQKLDFLMQVPQILQQISREFKKTDSAWKSAVKKANASKTDLSDLVAKGQAIHDELNALFEKMKSAVAAGDFDAIQAAMDEGDGAMDKQQDLFGVINTIEALRNTGRYLQQFNKRLSDMNRMMQKLKRQKQDVTELAACIQQARGVVEGTKVLLAQKPVDPDELAASFESAEDAFGQCQDVIDGLNGAGDQGIFDNFFSTDLRKGFEAHRQQPAPTEATPQEATF